MQHFEMNVTGVYSNDAMLRQISEGDKINNADEGSLMISKTNGTIFRFRVLWSRTDALLQRDEMSRGDVHEVGESVDCFNQSIQSIYSFIVNKLIELID